MFEHKITVVSSMKPFNWEGHCRTDKWTDRRMDGWIIDLFVNASTHITYRSIQYIIFTHTHSTRKSLLLLLLYIRSWVEDQCYNLTVLLQSTTMKVKNMLSSRLNGAIVKFRDSIVHQSPMNTLQIGFKKLDISFPSTNHRDEKWTFILVGLIGFSSSKEDYLVFNINIIYRRPFLVHFTFVPSD